MDDRPLGLKDLSEVDSPDVMRAALSNFRRRTLVRGIGFILLITAMPFFLRGAFQEQISSADALARAEQHEIGKIYEGRASRLIVLDARKVRDEEVRKLVPPAYSGGRFLRLVGTTSALRRGEQLEIAVGNPLAEGLGEKPPWPPIRVREIMFEFYPGMNEAKVFLIAATGREGPSRGPRTHRQRVCAVPLNEFNVCELFKSEGRIIDTFKIRFDDLGIPRSIWGVKSDVAPGEPPGPPLFPREP